MDVKLYLIFRKYKQYNIFTVHLTKILNFIEYANRIIDVVEGIKAFACNKRLTVLCFLQYLNDTPFLPS